MFIFFIQSDGGSVTLFTLTITIKESFAGGSASCLVCVRVIIFVSSISFSRNSKKMF